MASFTGTVKWFNHVKGYGYLDREYSRGSSPEPQLEASDPAEPYYTQVEEPENRELAPSRKPKPTQ